MSRQDQTGRITIRLTKADIATIDRSAKEFGVTKSDIIRERIFNPQATSAQISSAQISSPAGTPPEEIVEIRDQLGEYGRALDDIREVLTDILKRIEEMGNEIAENFNNLVQGINEIVRVPSFREYRGRCIVEGWEKYPKETDAEYTIRVAKAYYQKYGVWPDPVARPTDFGPLPKDMTAAWPKSPK